VMKMTDAVIGGEGNGGIIYPESHYGRDALVGMGLFLTQLALSGKSCSELRKQYPAYFMAKKKMELSENVNLEAILLQVKDVYKAYKITDVDGVRIDFEKEWVHLRKSNTEPIIRIYSESGSMERANALADRVIDTISGLLPKA
ncbi:MAG: phosphoglucosamine mutase, partial [Marinilabiliales bacterium]|nr:phosphoglucosamine mutase [Marinilabiliales bacterium]